MLFDKGVAGLDLIRQLGVEVKAKGTVSEVFADDNTTSDAASEDIFGVSAAGEGRRRLESTAETPEPEQSGFDLSQYISFELRRGDEDSAPADKLGYNVIVNSLDEDRIYLDLQFENPDQVSIGSKKDVVIGTIQDESFFSSKESNLSVKKGT